eukprot:m.75570 g.75570  ORF g.75570 m.75570 type:complete len:696 (+) comp24802_c0_seq1:124-2211(+)
MAISPIMLFLFVILWGGGNCSVGGDGCDTWYDRTKHGSGFRSVKDFGAKGDGVTDDTQAIQAAIDHQRGSVNQKKGAVVYFPSGTYTVSDTLVIYFYTHITGSTSEVLGCRSTIVLNENSDGFDDVTKLKPTIATDNGFNRSMSGHEWWEDPVDKNMLFYAQIHNIDLKLGETNVGATGILWSVAQQTSLRNITIEAGNAFSGLEVGFAGNSPPYAHSAHASPGGGGTVEDIVITGGQYGLRASASQWFLRSVRVSRSKVACATIPVQAWAITLVDFHAQDCPIGLELPASINYLVLMESSFTNITNHTAIVSTKPMNTGLVLANVTTTSVTKIVNDVLMGGGGTVTVASWRLSGTVYVDGTVVNTTGAGDLPHTSLSSAIPLRPRPALTDATNVFDTGAVADGIHDDTAAIQRAIDMDACVFLPFGTYLVSDTLTLRMDTQLVGEGMPLIILKANATGFGDETRPKAMIVTPNDADAHVLLADVALSSESGNYGAILLQWRSGSDSATYDVHVRLYTAVHTAVHITGFGGGVWSNMWGWGADHNLTDNTPMAPLLNNSTHWLGAISGMRIDSKGPTWLLGTAFEHHRAVMYNITGASDVTLLGSQTEHPYWLRGIVGTPACDASAVVVMNSTRVNMYGVVWCSWRCVLAKALASIVDSNDVNLFGVWSRGAKIGAIQGDRAVTQDVFTADIRGG